MENNGGNQNLASSLCKAGCGFFGNAQYDGMCSKCYKDFVKRKQAAPSDSSSATLNPCTPSTSSRSVGGGCLPTMVVDTSPCVETALPTVAGVMKPVCSTSDDMNATNTAEEGAESCAIPHINSGEDCDSGTESPSKSKKRNRCYTCKKKVGLTGFECRCGGVYCSIHRYSDKHSCDFDYKEHGADHIRKCNPVVVGSKVQKL